MFAFFKNTFFTAITFFSSNALKRVSVNNQEWKMRREIKNGNSNKPSFNSYSIKVNKCSSSSNNINDPYATLCVPDVAKNKNVKVFNLMSRTNKTRQIE